MSRFNTGNPLDSNDPRDLDDNAKNLDQAVNSEDSQWIDRFGRPRLPLMEQERRFIASQDSRDDQFQSAQSSRDDQFQSAQSSREAVFSNFLQASGYQDLGEYAPGIEITAHNQYVTFGGQPYLLKPSIPVPYTTSGAWTGDDFKLIGDDALRQDLANPDLGAAMVAYQSGSVADKLDEIVSGAVTEPLVDAKVYSHNHDPAAHPELSAFITQEADRAETAADQAESVKPYVDNALSDLSTAANKFYPTLAEANADIANIAVNQPVTVGDAVNGGLWYKATSEATSLTKSPYDPLTQAISYTDAAKVSPVFTGTPTAPTPSTTSNDDTLATTKFVNDFVDVQFNRLANVNIGSAVGDVVLNDFQLNSGILNIYGNPPEPVNLVFPDDTDKTYLLHVSKLPSTVVNVKFSSRPGVERLVGGAYHLIVNGDLGFRLPYSHKADIDSPNLRGEPTANSPNIESRANQIATANFVGRIAQGVILEDITDDSTEVSSTSGHTVCLMGTLTKDVTLTIRGASVNQNIGINIVNMTDGGKTVYIRGHGQNAPGTYIELKNGEGKSIYTRSSVAYSLNSQSSPPPASETSLGVVKIGSGINVDSSGTISVPGSGGGSGTNLSYSGKFKVGSDYSVGAVVEHGSGIYQVVSDVTNAQKPYDDASFQKIAHNYQAGEKGSITVLSNDYETHDYAYDVPYKLSKSGTLIFNVRTSPLRYSKDLGRTWLENPPLFTPPASSIILWVHETDDDELLIAVRQFVTDGADKVTIHKSQGWDGINGNTPEWTQVFDINRHGAIISEWGVSSHKSYVVMAEYGMQKGHNPDPEDYAQYAYLSKDYGETWETIFNLDDYVTTDSVHLHGICFDPYWNRIWISHGDGAYNASLGLGTNGLYYSDDLGKTWEYALETSGPGANFPQSVGIVALPTCILFSSDSYPNGVQRIDRAQGRIPVKGFYEIESAYLVPDSSTTGISQILTNAVKAEWLPNSPYIWGFAAEASNGKIGCVLSWDGWEFHEVWLSDNKFTRSTGVKAVMGITPENTIILSGTGEGEGGDDSVRWSRTIKVSLDV